MVRDNGGYSNVSRGSLALTISTKFTKSLSTTFGPEIDRFKNACTLILSIVNLADIIYDDSVQNAGFTLLMFIKYRLL
jgi:hypothetical protein